MKKVFVHGIPELPSGEPYERFVSDQKRYLEASKKNFRTAEEVDFFNARISNIIVDDVFTTNATTDEIARVLRRGGTRLVRAITIARA